MGIILKSMADKCVSCDKFRRMHQKGTERCPTGKVVKGLYVEFLDQKFVKNMPVSAITKNKIQRKQLFLCVKGGVHGYIIMDLHPEPSGDYVTVQRVTAMGRDGPLTRVDARIMAEVTHYEAEYPAWLKLTLKKK